MMAMLWAQQIMLGKKTYVQVPRLLKEKVKEILIDSGMEKLVAEVQEVEDFPLDYPFDYADDFVGRSGYDYPYDYPYDY